MCQSILISVALICFHIDKSNWMASFFECVIAQFKLPFNRLPVLWIRLDSWLYLILMSSESIHFRLIFDVTEALLYLVACRSVVHPHLESFRFSGDANDSPLLWPNLTKVTLVVMSDQMLSSLKQKLLFSSYGNGVAF